MIFLHQIQHTSCELTGQSNITDSALKIIEMKGTEFLPQTLVPISLQSASGNLVNFKLRLSDLPEFIWKVYDIGLRRYKDKKSEFVARTLKISVWKGLMQMLEQMALLCVYLSFYQ